MKGTRGNIRLIRVIVTRMLILIRVNRFTILIINKIIWSTFRKIVPVVIRNYRKEELVK